MKFSKRLKMGSGRRPDGIVDHLEYCRSLLFLNAMLSQGENGKVRRRIEKLAKKDQIGESPFDKKA